MTAIREAWVRQGRESRIGDLDNGCHQWEIYLEDQGGLDPWLGSSWAVYHPLVEAEAMPNYGYFETWREAMDYVSEYIKTYEWADQYTKVKVTW